MAWMSNDFIVSMDMRRQFFLLPFLRTSHDPASSTHAPRGFACGVQAAIFGFALYGTICQFEDPASIAKLVEQNIRAEGAVIASRESQVRSVIWYLP